MKSIFGFLILFFFISYGFSDTLSDLTSPALAQKLNSGGGPITEIQLKNPSPVLLPKIDELRRFVGGIQASLDPSVAVETLYLYKKPVSSVSQTGNWTSAQRSDLYNQILALSTLAGIEYYSASRKAMRTFYETSAVIDGPATKNPLPDPVFSQPPPEFTLYARQKDLTFGDNIYRYEFRSPEGIFMFSQENITALNYGIIPAVGKNRLQSVMAVIDCGDFLLLYAVSMAKAASIPGMGDRIGNSFANRAEAMLKWFTNRADSVFLSK
jgi:hypothetical protein